MNYVTNRLKKDYFSWWMPMQLSKKPSSCGYTSKFQSQTLSQGHMSLAFDDLAHITKNFWYEWNFMFRIFNTQVVLETKSQIFQVIGYSGVSNKQTFTEYCCFYLHKINPTLIFHLHKQKNIQVNMPTYKNMYVYSEHPSK